jgi:UDP-N-acetylglucosamine 2-epimerase (non-hydrolysing)
LFTRVLIASIIGARPQFIKLAVLCHAFRGWPDVEYRSIHTSHDLMSGSFFRDLAIPDPDVNLGVGSGTHAAQTADSAAAEY